MKGGHLKIIMLGSATSPNQSSPPQTLSLENHDLPVTWFFRPLVPSLVDQMLSYAPSRNQGRREPGRPCNLKEINKKSSELYIHASSGSDVESRSHDTESPKPASPPLKSSSDRGSAQHGSESEHQGRTELSAFSRSDMNEDQSLGAFKGKSSRFQSDALVSFPLTTCLNLVRSACCRR